LLMWCSPWKFKTFLFELSFHIFIVEGIKESLVEDSLQYVFFTSYQVKLYLLALYVFFTSYQVVIFIGPATL
jgi:hypothetical protein